MLMMFPFEAPTIFEGVHKSHFRMPRVVRDQKGKFENDDLFRQLSNESLVKYTAFKERPLEERQVKFITGCQEGHTEISFTQSGNQFILTFNPTLNPAISGEGCDFDKEMDKVHIKSPFILNGVCVVWRGYIDLRRLDGSGCLEFDECRAYLEEHASKISVQDNTMNLKQQQHQQQQQQPFNMLCNNSALNQSNVAAAAALAAASAASANPFHPAVSSPLSRYPSAGAITSLPPQPQLTPPSSQHQAATRISPTLNNSHSNLNNNPLPPQQPAITIPTTTTTPLTNGCPPMQINNNNNNNNSITRSPQHQNNIHNNHNQLTHQQQQQVPITQPPPPQMTQAHLAAAMGAMGANGQGPPMSLADSYGNAAIAAAAAAAFHQALSASQQQQHQHHQEYQQHLAQQHHHHHQQQQQHQQHQQNHHQQAVAAAMGLGAPVDFLAEMSVHRQRAS